jgi:TonB-dependent SusC/RagA subfamily outer membrane receptor
MMNKEKTQPIYKIKWLLLPIVAAVILLSFNAKRAIATNVDFADYSEIPEPSVENDTLVNKIPAAPPASKLKGKIVNIKKTANDTIFIDDAKSVTVISPGKDTTLFIVGYGDDSLKRINKFDPSDCLIIIDGKKSNKTELSKLKNDTIHSFSIYKNDMIVVVTKGNEDVSKQEPEQEWDQEMETIPFAIVKPEPLIFIDGKESDRTELSKLKRDAIESVSILKEKSATELYGEKGKNGVILVVTKKI